MLTLNTAMRAEQASLEAKNHELIDAFREKTKSQQQTQKLYQALKAQVMASHVANAAGDEAEFTLQTARGDRYINRLPGTRTGTANFNQMGVGQQAGAARRRNRDNSRSSGSSNVQGGNGLGPAYTLQGRGLGDSVHTGREYSFIFSTTKTLSTHELSLDALSLMSHRIGSSWDTLSDPAKPPSNSWWYAAEYLPSSKRWRFLQRITND